MSATIPTITLKDLGKLSEDLDDYMLWAQRWHKQAGGYTASDTFITMYRMEEWAQKLEAVTGLPETRLRDNTHLRKSNPVAEEERTMSKIIDADTVLTESDMAELKQVIAVTDEALSEMRNPPPMFSQTPTPPMACNSRYYPLFEHMHKEHGLTLVDSEMDEIVRIASDIAAAMAEQWS